MRFLGIDLETAPTEGHPEEYALQPWRVRDGQASITSVAISTTAGDYVTEQWQSCVEAVSTLTPKPVCATWSGVFDISWLYASGFNVDGLLWADAMLMWKWIDNGQMMEERPAWDLASGARRWLSDQPWTDDFIKMKHNPASFEDSQYWKDRNILDALATRMIAERIWEELTPLQRNSVIIEATCLVPIAKSWVDGILLDDKKAAGMAPVIVTEMYEIEQRLNLVTPPDNRKKDREAKIALQGVEWVPSKILSSPKQLAKLIYDTWGLPCTRTSETTGDPSTDKTALTYLADQDSKVLEILRWRMLNTQYTKFIKGIAKSVEYLGSNVIHPQPKIFSTYTGRMTYSSKSGNKGSAAKARIGVAIHQWPRVKELRKLIVAPPGYLIGELDASGQEVRWMAVQSQDRNLIDIFNSKPPFDDVHSFTGAMIGGIGFEEFVTRYHAGEDFIAGPTGLRYLGKVDNLSNQYRIGHRKMRLTSRVQYGVDATEYEIKRWIAAYHGAYPGIKQYWSRAISDGYSNGFAETVGGRRYKLEFWDDTNKWRTESSSINAPIQGTGADQKELAIATLYKKFPHVPFLMDLHDGLFYLLKDDGTAKQTLLDMKEVVNNLDYKTAWNFEPPIPLPFDAALGKTWADKEEI